MSKVLVIPDCHLKIDVIETGLKLAEKVWADNIILLGDYFDDWYAIPIDYYDMMDYLKILLRTRPNIITLLGNHELSYLGFPCSGHNKKVESYIKKNLENDMRFYPAAEIDGVLYSHAGVCTKWIRENKLLTENEIRYRLTKIAGAKFLEKGICNQPNLLHLMKVGGIRGGHSSPSCVWADAKELIADAIPKVVQVVGHTPMKHITNVENLWFTDVFSNYNMSDEYLFVKEGIPEILHAKEILDEE